MWNGLLITLTKIRQSLTRKKNFLSFFFWSLCCLSFFDIRILIIPLVSSNSSYIALIMFGQIENNTNNDLQNNTHKTKDRVRRTPLKTEVNSIWPFKITHRLWVNNILREQEMTENGWFLMKEKNVYLIRSYT
jgi:hypothetical protein